MTGPRGERFPQGVDERAGPLAPSAAGIAETSAPDLRPERPSERRSDRRGAWAAAGAAAVLAVAWSVPLAMERSAGWDESMHVALPAARIALALRAGAAREAIDAVLDCSQYPFVHPALLGSIEFAIGVSERAARVLGTALWATTLFGLFLLVREVVRSSERGTASVRSASAHAGISASRGEWAPWLAMTFAALSPLALAYAGTLFLEVPFACASAWTLRAWARRVRLRSVRAELAAGAWIAACVFTKFNYGLLLAFGFAVAWLVELVEAARERELAPFLRRTSALALVPAVVLAWWFLCPWPAGAETAGIHRQALVEFLSGNRAAPRVPGSQRLFHAAAFATATPRLFALELAGVVLALTRVWKTPAVRAVALALFALAVPAWLHPFHLERFWIPVGVSWWALAGVGAGAFIGRDKKRTAAMVAALAIALVPLGGRDVRWLARALGELSADPKIRDYQIAIYDRWRDLSGARSLPTAGLERGAFDSLFDAIAREVGPAERVAWIGMSSEISPAALHLELLARGGSPERLRRDAKEPMDVAYFGDDPRLDDEALDRFARGFDVILYTDPIDLKDRASRRFVRAYVDRLVERRLCQPRAIATVEVPRPLAPPRTVTLFACRPTR